LFHYPFHVSDYIADTAHLTLEEDIAYRRLLDLYYTNENPIPNDPTGVARRVRMPMHIEVVASVLQEFFTLAEDDCWHKARCDAEIDKFRWFAEAGKRGAEKRWGKSTQDSPPNSPPNDTPYPGPIGTENREPRTENQIKEGKPSLSATGFPTCPHQEILTLWKKHLPHLSQPRVWEGTRQANLRQRWQQAAKPSAYSPKGYKTLAEGLEWWDGFLGYIAQDTKLADGFETGGRVWRPDLEWVVNAANFQKIIDGKYNK
jgi:uncharacterized protein YdaU (DUF1376 family)